MDENMELLRAEMDRQGIVDNTLRAGIAAIIGGESGFKPHTETPYRNTANDRIRGIFRTAFAGKPDSFIDAMKADDEVFFNYVYGADGAGHDLGNLLPDDGYRYRGRGGIQLTGRGNYTKLAALTNLPLIDDPDLVNDPQNSVAISVAYMRWRYHGGGWDAMKKAVGNSFGNVDDRKNALFAEYQRTGEFAVGAKPLDHVDQADAISPLEKIKAIQLVLGVVQDGAFGRRSRAALYELLAAAGQPGI